MIFESPDKGQTVFIYNTETNERTLITKSNKLTYSTYNTYIDIINTAKQVPALQQALDNVILLYELAKDNGK